jgi:hypothetical protein
MGGKNISRVLVNDNLPFNENKYNNISIRTFSEDVTNEDLMWHRDEEDRLITPLHETNWLIQLDNELPQQFDKPIFIEKEKYHRLIKGDGNLKLKVEKYETFN